MIFDLHAQNKYHHFRINIYLCSVGVRVRILFCVFWFS